MIRQAFTSKNVTRHKIRFDRGGVYLNYITFLVSIATMLKVFNASWWFYLGGVIFVFIFRYITGLIDERLNVFKNEQDKYAKENPTIKRMSEQIEELWNQMKK